jgi:hypothetical protein
MKNVLFWDVTLCSVTEIYGCLGASISFRNVGAASLKVLYFVVPAVTTSSKHQFTAVTLW